VVKQGILLGFRIGKLAESGDPRVLSFVDKDTYRRHFAASEQVRVIPGGSSVRSGPMLPRPWSACLRCSLTSAPM